MTRSSSLGSFPPVPSRLLDRLPVEGGKVLLWGPSGSGKSSLAAGLAAELALRGREAVCVAADPGSPSFGPPGAACLGIWRDGVWATQRVEALCTLDAARFRLPLAKAVASLAARPVDGTLLVDTPGVARGVAAAELLDALARSAGADLVLVLGRAEEPQPLADELAALGLPVAWVEPAQAARALGPAARARLRTALWDRYLAGAGRVEVPLDDLVVLGTPPRRAADAWIGKQLAFLDGGRTLAMGEAIGMTGGALHVLLPPGQSPTGTLLVRDAGRGREGYLETVRPFAADTVRYCPPPDAMPDATAIPSTGPRPVVQVGQALGALVNGVLGDPLLHLRLRHQRRSLLFDLGEGARLPARIAHQVTDCFVTHAHADHIGGLTWLIRSRIGESAVCRLYGPPGLAAHVQGFLAGFLWDRIGERGPVLEVSELDGERLRRYRLQAGIRDPVPLDEGAAADGVVLDEPGFRVRAVELDHGTPSLAYCFEPKVQIHVRKDRLEARGLQPGPWLTDLKRRILAADWDAEVPLPDGTRQPLAELAADLTLSAPGERLCYATDFADSPGNRARLVALAAGAHTLLCESCFMERDRAQAERTGHLTARACGEIASAAGVRYLIPFHISRRYEDDLRPLYAEVAAACPQTVIPR